MTNNNVVHISETTTSISATFLPASFEDFWALYPRRVAKKDAMKAWSRLRPEQHVQALSACVDWRPIWAGKDLEFIAHPATWLNGWRFEDELPTQPRISAAAHLPASLPAEGPRETMPEKVREALAKLRRKS